MTNTNEVSLLKAAQADQLSAPEIPTWLIEADVSRVWGIAWESAIKHAIERKAVEQAKAVEAVCSCPSGDGSLRWPCKAHPPSVEAVAYIQSYKGEFNNLFKADAKEFAESMARPHEHYTYTPLYTTPPSVDALIAEIDWLGTISWGTREQMDGVDYDELKAVLDKYRSVK